MTVDLNIILADNLNWSKIKELGNILSKKDLWEIDVILYLGCTIKEGTTSDYNYWIHFFLNKIDLLNKNERCFFRLSKETDMYLKNINLFLESIILYLQQNIAHYYNDGIDLYVKQQLNNK